MLTDSDNERRHSGESRERRKRRSKRRRRDRTPRPNPILILLFGGMIGACALVAFFPGVLGLIRQPGFSLRDNPEWIVVGLALTLGLFLIPGFENAVMVKLGLRKKPRYHRWGGRGNSALTAPLSGTSRALKQPTADPSDDSSSVAASGSSSVSSRS